MALFSATYGLRTNKVCQIVMLCSSKYHNYSLSLCYQTNRPISYMSLLEIVWIAFGLSMDSFAVSLSSGAQLHQEQRRKGIKIALFLALFQGGMTFIGWSGGVHMRHFVANYAHWIAMATLLFLGGKMVLEGIANLRCEPNEERHIDPSHTPILIGLSIATSIDALAVGVSMALLQVDAMRPAIIIGITTLGCSLVGYYLGRRCGKRLQYGAAIMGGAVLILLGLKIIATHYVLL